MEEEEERERRKLRGHQEGGPSISLEPAANHGSSRKAETRLQGGAGGSCGRCDAGARVQPLHQVVTGANWPRGGRRRLSFQENVFMPTSVSFRALRALRIWVAEHNFQKEECAFAGAFEHANRSLKREGPVEAQDLAFQPILVPLGQGAGATDWLQPAVNYYCQPKPQAWGLQVAGHAEPRMLTEKRQSKADERGSRPAGSGKHGEVPTASLELLVTSVPHPSGGAGVFWKRRHLHAVLSIYPNTREIPEQPTWQALPGQPRLQQGRDTRHRQCPQEVRLQLHM